MKCAVLLSVYNAAPTLDRTLASLHSQTFQDFRIVAINDASTDTSHDLLMNWQERIGSDRFTIIENEYNLGLTRSLNKGLSIIHEAYTARIDSDDWWHPEKLKKQVAYLEESQSCGVIGCFYENFTQKRSKVVIVPVTDAEIKSAIFKRNPFAHSAVVFQTELVKNAGSYSENLRYGQDYELWLRLMPETVFHNLPEILCFRSAENTLTARKQRAQMFQSVKTLWQYLRQYHRPLNDYGSLLEPILVALAPDWLRSLKRRLL